MSSGQHQEDVIGVPARGTRWWSLANDDVMRRLATDADNGLADAEAAARLERYGRNELAEELPIPLWRRIAEHLRDVFVWVLVAAAAISALIGDWIDMAAILAIVVLNVAIGFVQEERAGRALAALRKLSSPTVRVLRGGSVTSVAAYDVVPGDIVDLEAGDRIPADVRILKAYGFRVQEAALTGESVPIDKDANCVLDENLQLADRRNMVFMGTTAAAGHAKGVVVATGMATELGQIAGLLQQYVPEPTPLQRRLADLGRVLIVACLVVVAIVFALHLYRGGEFLEVLLLSISLAVAAVPEGLPAVVTITLAVGLQRMVKRNALVRSLPSVETLGTVTVICTDKTGTLTRNEMTVREIFAGGKHYQVTGTGYAPRGQFVLMQDSASGDNAEASASKEKNKQPDASSIVEPASNPDLIQALTIGIHCNEATLQHTESDGGGWTVVGDPTEGALLVAAAKAGIDVDRVDRDLVHEIPFDSERKAMSVVVRGDNSQSLMYTKGAPEVILDKCTAILRNENAVTFTKENRDELQLIGSQMASRALRVLALAYRSHGTSRTNHFPEEELVFAGLIGMIDPPREEAIAAVHRCREAGIRPVMITGDHPETATAIARETGIAEEGETSVTGAALDEYSDETLAEEVAKISVYARVSANHKLRVIKAWKQRDDVVAMTGDGVNDAPAVKAADVGIAMGLTGSDVTKESADMVLTDDNFASIVNAVEEGRGIFDNIQKFVHYLLSCNAAEVLLMLIAGLAGWPAPLTALQILWINLVTDGLPALALGMEPTERDAMQRQPRGPHDPIISWQRGFQILGHGSLMAVVATFAFWWVYRGDAGQLRMAQSVTFCVVAYMQLFYSLSCRSQRNTMPEIGLTTNAYLLVAIVISAIVQLAVVLMPGVKTVFRVEEHTMAAWMMILLASLTPVSLIELSKLVRRQIVPSHP